MGPDPERPPERPNDRPACALLHASSRLASQIGAQVSAVRLGLEADQVEEGEAAHELLVHGQGRQELAGRQGRVQKKAHPVADAEPTQFLAERNQMVIMDPDDVVGPQHAGQLSGKVRVDAPIAGVIPALEVDEIDAVVKKRPERGVGEAVVILLVVAFAEIHAGAGHPPALGQVHGLVGDGDDLAAPAEPDAPGAPERGKHGDGQTAGGGPALVDRRDPVRNDDHSVRHASPRPYSEANVAGTA